MPPPAAPPVYAPLPDLAAEHVSWQATARRGTQVLLVCVLLGLVLGYVRGHDHLRSVIYSVAIGGHSWGLIELGSRLLRRRGDPSPWPGGWRGPVLCVSGCVAGFALGTALGDWVNGVPVWGGYQSGNRRIGMDALVSGLVGGVLSLYYYLRGRNAFHQAQVARHERDLTLARLAALQGQLEPHMLFNTLANLRVLIGLDAPRAQAMLDRLNAYLRATLGASRATLHPLSAEFERLQDYLALMAVRMGPRLALAVELPEPLRALPVPPLLLQPLVENAIRHGLEPAEDGGRITLRAARVPGLPASGLAEQLLLSVHDTGAGLPPQHVDGPVVTQQPGSAPRADGHGVGTQLVAERMAALFGPQASLHLSHAPAGHPDGPGTLAELRLPLLAPELVHAAALPTTASAVQPTTASAVPGTTAGAVPGTTAGAVPHTSAPTARH